MPPFRGGGEMIDVVATDYVTYNDPPHRFEAGTPPIVEVVGLGAAIRWLNAQDRVAAHAHEQALLERATTKLAEFNWLTIYGRASGKGAILSFAVDGVHPHDLATFIDRRGVAVRAGHHCAQPLMHRLDVPATTRASFALYNTMKEVDALVDAVVAAREFFA
jgi:cysteine desulfurase/selenocysteine lyase